VEANAAVIVTVDQINYGNHVAHVDLETSFFIHFTLRSLLNRLAKLLFTSGQAPLVLLRRTSSSNQQNLIIAPHDHADANKWVFRVFSGH
jgi:hypothetical protein